MADDEGPLDQFRAREAQIDAYARTWWSQPVQPQASFLRDHPEVRARVIQMLAKNRPVGTQDVYSTDGGLNWEPERLRMQDGLLNTLSAEDLPTPKDETSSTAPRGPVYFLLGLPGSGKTRSLRPIATAHAMSHAHLPTSDADEIRVRLPEYADGLGSGVVQVETVLLTYGVGMRLGQGRQQRILARGDAVMIDVIGDAEFLVPAIRELVSQSRSVYLLRAECGAEICKDRVMHRTLETGRYVPLALVDAKVGYPERAMTAALESGLVSGWGTFDTSGMQVKVIASDGTFDGFTSGPGRSKW